MRVFCLQPELIDQCWSDFAVILQWFESELQNMTADQVVEAVKGSNGQLWGLQDAERVHGIALTEIQQTARGLVCVIVGAYGKAPESDKRALLEAIEEWARERGCVRMKIIGRKGWLRWDRRFKQTAVVMEMAL